MNSNFAYESVRETPKTRKTLREKEMHTTTHTRADRMQTTSSSLFSFAADAEEFAVGWMGGAVLVSMATSSLAPPSRGRQSGRWKKRN